MSKTVWTKYKTQLDELMADLEKSESRYIRCIKPNSIKAPKILEHAMTLEQLRSAGVVTAVTMSRAAFPNRMEHEHILDRFAPIWRLFWCRAEGKKLPPKSKRFYQKIYFKDKVEGLLSVALKELETFKDDKSKPAYAVGKTRTYFCAGALEYLEARRFQGYGLCAIAIQSWFRGNAVRKKTFNIELFRRRIRARRGVQGWWRITKAKRCLAVLRHKHMAAAGILRLQCWARMLQAQNVTRHLLIDAEQERRLRQQEVKRLKNRQFAAARIQGLFRGVVQRRKFSTELCVSHKYAEMDDECSQLQRELRELEEAYELAEMKREQDIRKAEKKVKDAMSRSFSAALYDHVMNSPTGRRKNVFETDKVKAQRKLNRKLRKSTQALQEEKVAIKKNCETLKKSNREARGAICDARTAKLKLIVRDQRLEAEAEIWEDEAEKYRLLKITRLHQCEVEKLNRYKYLSTVKKCVKLVKKRIPDTRLARDVERIATEYITTEAARHGKGQDSEVSYYSTTANELSDSSDSSDSSLDDASITL
jgi:myosin-5